MEASRIERATAARLSDEAFARALPEIKAWEARGKPYGPGAAEPKDLPQAKIPAFPGAWGGGMYSFGGRGGKRILVTNLNDRGPGKFREAIEKGRPRAAFVLSTPPLSPNSHTPLPPPPTLHSA